MKDQCHWMNALLRLEKDMFFKENDVTEGSITRYFHWLTEKMDNYIESNGLIISDDSSNYLDTCPIHGEEIEHWKDDDDDTDTVFCESCLRDAEDHILVLRKEYWTGLDEDEVSNEEIVDVDIESVDDSNV